MQFDPEGRVRLKLVDFEPESKMLVPIEFVSSRFRQLKLKRKAIRYLKEMRIKFSLNVSIATEIG